MSLNPLPYREVKRNLEAAGFSLESSKGSYVKSIYPSAFGKKVGILPKHSEIVIGTLRSIVRQMGISQDLFEEL